MLTYFEPYNPTLNFITNMMSVQIKRQLIVDISVRTILWILFLWLDHLEPFVRIIQPEEVWLYKYPVTSSYVSSTMLWCIVFFVPTSFIFFEYMNNKNKIELKEVLLSLTLNYGLTGDITQFLKLIVGRPRPDFYYRCFPEGIGTDFTRCTGERKSVIDGRKSFPSGHSAFAFSSMVFLSLYLAGKLKIFNDGGRGISWRFCACVLPLILASGIAISRTCDYHHHWQDVMIGSLLGSITAYLCYRQYYPSLSSPYSNIPFAVQSLTMES